MKATCVFIVFISCCRWAHGKGASEAARLLAEIPPAEPHEDGDQARRARLPATTVLPRTDAPSSHEG